MNSPNVSGDPPRVSSCSAFYRSGGIGATIDGFGALWNPVGKLTGYMIQQVPGVKLVIAGTTKIFGCLVRPCLWCTTRRLADSEARRMTKNTLSFAQQEMQRIANALFKRGMELVTEKALQMQHDRVLEEIKTLKQIQNEFGNPADFTERVRALNNELSTTLPAKLEGYSKGIEENQAAINKIENDTITSKGTLWNNYRELTKEEKDKIGKFQSEISALKEKIRQHPAAIEAEKKKQLELCEKFKGFKKLYTKYQKCITSPKKPEESSPSAVLSSPSSDEVKSSSSSADAVSAPSSAVLASSSSSLVKDICDPTQYEAAIDSMGIKAPWLESLTSRLPSIHVSGLMEASATVTMAAIDEDDINRAVEEIMDRVEETKAFESFIEIFSGFLYGQFSENGQEGFGKAVMKTLEFGVNCVVGSYVWTYLIPPFTSDAITVYNALDQVPEELVSNAGTALRSFTVSNLTVSLGAIFNATLPIGCVVAESISAVGPCEDPTSVIFTAKVMLASGVLAHTAYKVYGKYKDYKAAAEREKLKGEHAVENFLKSAIKVVLDVGDTAGEGLTILVIDKIKEKLRNLANGTDKGLERKIKELLKPVENALGQKQAEALYNGVKKLCNNLINISPQNLRRFNKVMAAAQQLGLLDPKLYSKVTNAAAAVQTARKDGENLISLATR